MPKKTLYALLEDPQQQITSAFLQETMLIGDYVVKAPERIAFKHAVLVYKCFHGSAPAYLTDELCQVADVEARRRLHSSSSSSLIVSRT